jgi:hypothetical protein
VDIQVYDGGAKGSPLGLFCSTVYPRISGIRKTSIATHDESTMNQHPTRIDLQRIMTTRTAKLAPTPATMAR